MFFSDLDAENEDAQNLQEVLNAYAVTTDPWQITRLNVVEQLLRNELTADEIAEIYQVSRRSIFNHWKRFTEGGVQSLLTRGKSSGRPPILRGVRMKEFKAKVSRGSFPSTVDAQAWIYHRTGKHMTKRGVLKSLRRIESATDE